MKTPETQATLTAPVGVTASSKPNSKGLTHPKTGMANMGLAAVGVVPAVAAHERLAVLPGKKSKKEDGTAAEVDQVLGSLFSAEDVEALLGGSELKLTQLQTPPESTVLLAQADIGLLGGDVLATEAERFMPAPGVSSVPITPPPSPLVTGLVNAAGTAAVTGATATTAAAGSSSLLPAVLGGGALMGLGGGGGGSSSPSDPSSPTGNTLGTVTISGTIKQASTLTAAVTDADGTVGGINYQWYANGQLLDGVTGDTYTLTENQVGKKIKVEATYTDTKGIKSTISSSETGAVDNVNDPLTGQLSINGLVKQGEELTAVTSSLTDADGLSEAALQYQWYSNDIPISGATSKKYRLSENEVNKTIKVKVNYLDGHGTPEEIFISTANTVANLNDPATGNLIIVNNSNPSDTTPKQGQTLSVVNDIQDLDGLNGVTFIYKWYTGTGEELTPNSNQTSYTLTADEVNQQIYVVVRYEDNHGSTETITSAKTAYVEDKIPPIYQTMTVHSGSAGSAKIVLTYDTPLKPKSPATSAYKVTVNGVSNTPSEIQISDNTVTIILAQAIESDQSSVALTYNQPATNPIQDVWGNKASGLVVNPGTVTDGYIRNAQLYLDTPNGLVILEDVTTDTNGNFYITNDANPQSYPLVAVGGINIDTGLPNTIKLKAPAGSSTINPLTTLVQQALDTDKTLSVDQASDLVTKAFGLTLPNNTLLTEYNPLAIVPTSNSNNALEVAYALQTQKAAVSVATLLGQVENQTKLVNAGLTTDQVNAAVSTALSTVLNNLVQEISQTVADGRSISLSDATTINKIVANTTGTNITGIISSNISDIAGAASIDEITVEQAQALDTQAPAMPTRIEAIPITKETQPTIKVYFNTQATDGTAVVAGDKLIALLDNGGALPLVSTEIDNTIVVLQSADIVNGYKTITPLNAIADGLHTFAVQLIDKNQNTSTKNSTNITIDNTAPVATIGSVQNTTSLITGNTLTVTFNLSETSTDFTLNDITAVGGTLSGFSGYGQKYTATFTPTPQTVGSGSISIAPGKFTDSVGNSNAAGNTLALSINTAINTAPTSPGNTIDFFEDEVYTFKPEDLRFDDGDTNFTQNLLSIIVTKLPVNGTGTLTFTKPDHPSTVTVNQEILAADLPYLVYTPPKDSNGSSYATIGFKVKDDGGTVNNGSNTSKTESFLTFNVKQTNDNPIVINSSPDFREINGIFSDGNTLTVTTPLFTDVDGLTHSTFYYQWLATDSIGLITTIQESSVKNTYTLTPQDVNKQISVIVTYKDDAGNDNTYKTKKTEIVADDRAPEFQKIELLTNDKKIILTYDEPLDTIHIPSTDIFTITVAGIQLVVNQVSVANGINPITAKEFGQVIIELQSSITNGEFKLLYTDDKTTGNVNGPDNNRYNAAIQDKYGNDAISLDASGATKIDILKGTVTSIRGAQIYLQDKTNPQAGVVTDNNGNFFITKTTTGLYTSPLLAINGFDTTTGVANKFTLKAPTPVSDTTPSFLINSLTTLVQAVKEVSSTPLTTSEANTKVVSALGLTLPSGQTLLTYDPWSDLNTAKQASAVATLLNLVSTMKSSEATASQVLNKIATKVLDPLRTGTISLNDTAVLTYVLKDVTDLTPDSINTVTNVSNTKISTSINNIYTAASFANIIQSENAALDNTTPAIPTALKYFSPQTGKEVDSSNDQTPTIRVLLNTSATDGSAAIAGNHVGLFEYGKTDPLVAFDSSLGLIKTSDIVQGYIDISVPEQASLATNVSHAIYARIIDSSNRSSKVSNTLELTIDVDPPIIEIYTTKSSLKTGETSGITFKLKQSILDFTKEDISAENGTLINFQQDPYDPLIYKAEFIPNDNIQGIGSIKILKDKFTDIAGNFNSEAISPDIVIDTFINKAPSGSDIVIASLQEDHSINFDTLNYQFSSGGDPYTQDMKGLFITSLPQYGKLYLTVNGVTKEFTSNDLTNGYSTDPNNLQTGKIFIAKSSLVDLTYIPFDDINSTTDPIRSDFDTFKFQLQDTGGTSNIGSVDTSAEFSLTIKQVVAINDAPRLKTDAITLAGIVEDVGVATIVEGNKDTGAASIKGDTVQNLFGTNLFTDDADGTAKSTFAGIVITVDESQDTTKGYWEYSTDNGTNWYLISGSITTYDDYGTPSDVSFGVNATAGLLLDPTAKLRFVPKAGWHGETAETPALSIKVIESGGAFTFSSYDSITKTTVRSTFDTTLSITDNTNIQHISENTAKLLTSVGSQPDAPLWKNTSAGVQQLSSGLQVSEDMVFVATNKTLGLSITSLFNDATTPFFSDEGDAPLPNGFAGIVITGNAAKTTEGTWKYLPTGASSWTDISTTLSTTQTLWLAASTKLLFVPKADWNGIPGALTTYPVDDSNPTLLFTRMLGSTLTPVTAALSTGGTAVGTVGATFSTTVNATHDRPVTFSGTTTLTTIDEMAVIDSTTKANIPGDTISSLFVVNKGTVTFSDITDKITNTNGSGSIPDTLAGVAITSTTNTTGIDGTWEYSTDAGSSWLSVGNRTATDALLLDLNAKLRFVPQDAYAFGTPKTTLNAYAIDSGLSAVNSGTTVNTSDASLSQFISTGSATLNTAINAVNQPPTTADASTSIKEDTTLKFSDLITFSGNTNTVLENSPIKFNGTGPMGENDGFQAIFIESMSGNGTLTFGGKTYSSASLSSEFHFPVTKAQLASLIYQPATDEYGIGYASIGFSVQDDNASTKGSRTSDPVNTLTISVSSVNDAPLFKNNITLPAVSEDVSNLIATGVSITSLFTSAFDDSKDKESSNDFAGIAITGDNSTSSQGKWQYNTNNGDTGSWFDVKPTTGSLSSTQALLLQNSESVKLRFLPTANWNGSPGSLTVAAVEKSASHTDVYLNTNNSTVAFSFTNGNTRGTLDTTSTTQASLAQDLKLLNTTVTAVNDPPTFDSISGALFDASLPSIAEDTTKGGMPDASIKSVSSLFASLFKDVTDNQQSNNLTGSTENAFAGIAIASSGDLNQGNWWYKLTGQSSEWTVFPTDLGANKALLLDKDTALMFVPNANWYGNVSPLPIFAVDNSATFVSGFTTKQGGAAYTDPTADNGRSDSNLSVKSIKLGTIVIGSNDHPSWLLTTTPTLSKNPTTQLYQSSVKDLFINFFSDPIDSSAHSNAATPNGLEGIAIATNATGSNEGIWQYSTNSGSNWTDLPFNNLGDDHALLLNLDTLLQFVPATNWTGTTSNGLKVYAIDDSTEGATLSWSSNSTPAYLTDHTQTKVSDNTVVLQALVL